MTVPDARGSHRSPLTARRRRRLVAGATLVTVLAAAAMPATASAHGFFDRVDSPIPTWLFGWAAALVLVVSFVALGVMWSKPKLDGDRWRPLPPLVSRVLAGPVADALYGLVGVVLLAIVVWSGLAGRQSIEQNLAPTFVYVTFWVGLVPASVLFGDVFRALNPWRAVARAAVWTARRVTGRPLRAPFRYPERLGFWPAIAGLLGFAAFELVVQGGNEPGPIARGAIAYSVVTFIGMALFGTEPWLDRGEGFSVYFNLCSRVAVFERRARTIGLRPPLAGLA
ncbi:MAG: fenitrothion hydrolase, partial [Actinomycetota bacterium]